MSASWQANEEKESTATYFKVDTVRSQNNVGRCGHMRYGFAPAELADMQVGSHREEVEVGVGLHEVDQATEWHQIGCHGVHVHMIASNSLLVGRPHLGCRFQHGGCDAYQASS